MRARRGRHLARPDAGAARSRSIAVAGGRAGEGPWWAERSPLRRPTALEGPGCLLYGGGGGEEGARRRCCCCCCCCCWEEGRTGPGAGRRPGEGWAPQRLVGWKEGPTGGKREEGWGVSERRPAARRSLTAEAAARRGQPADRSDGREWNHFRAGAAGRRCKVPLAGLARQNPRESSPIEAAWEPPRPATAPPSHAYGWDRLAPGGGRPDGWVGPSAAFEDAL
eukprot:scaffold706_cov418-Prasinococcus_capsulatus_cf.AAC.67